MEPDLLQKLLDEKFTQSVRQLVKTAWAIGVACVMAVVTGTITVVRYVDRVDHSLAMMQKDVSSVTDLAVQTGKDVFIMEQTTAVQATRIAVIEALLKEPSR